jgi:hypothetical protein
MKENAQQEYCVDCRGVSPAVETHFLLITSYRWRFTRRMQAGTVITEWRCGVCSVRNKRRAQSQPGTIRSSRPPPSRASESPTRRPPAVGVRRRT